VRYRNISNSTLTFYGVTFAPGDVKDVPGAINAAQFIRTDEPVTEDAPENKADTKVAAKTTEEKPATKSTKTTSEKKKEVKTDGTDND